LHEITGEFGIEDQDEPIAPKQVQSTSSHSNMVSVLEARREMYIKAVATAKASADTAKARRYDRQLKVAIRYRGMNWILHSAVLFFMFRLFKNYFKQLVLVHQLMKVIFHLHLMLVLHLHLNQKMFHNKHLFKFLLYHNLLEHLCR
jgi:hypothetical protein